MVRNHNYSGGEVEAINAFTNQYFETSRQFNLSPVKELMAEYQKRMTLAAESTSPTPVSSSHTRTVLPTFAFARYSEHEAEGADLGSSSQPKEEGTKKIKKQHQPKK